jgi:pyridoxine 5'-phosphate synthase PdxJ
MNIEGPKEIPSEHADKMNKKTIEKLKNITEKANDGNVEVRSFIDSSKRKFDELSISIRVWCNKKNLKEIFPLDSRSAKK